MYILVCNYRNSDDGPIYLQLVGTFNTYEDARNEVEHELQSCKEQATTELMCDDLYVELNDFDASLCDDCFDWTFWRKWMIFDSDDAKEFVY